MRGIFTAYFDTENIDENIDLIIPYINDVSGKTFFKMDSLQRFVVTEVSQLGTVTFFSGIHFYWKDWFTNSKAKREKLFQYFTNWTVPKSINVTVAKKHKHKNKNNFSSKIVMGFYLYAVLSIVYFEHIYVCHVSTSLSGKYGQAFVSF